MNDLISRQAVIYALVEWYGCKPNDIEAFEEIIEALPSVQLERKKGFWYTLKKGDKGYSAGDFKCSVCGEPNPTQIPRPKFCPNCGADMSVYEEPIKISVGIN